MKLLVFASLICFVAKSSGLICWECEDAFGQDECLRKGRAVECESNENFCHLSLRHGGWGPTPWIEKTCKSLKSCADNYVQNVRPAWSNELGSEQIQCNENSPSSVCRCCCTGDLCNQDRTSCLLVNECSFIERPRRGNIECTDGYNLLSECEITCHQGSALVGKEILYCNAFGNWSSPPPTCERITCPNLKTPDFGTQRCLNPSRRRTLCTDATCDVEGARSNLGSFCQFSCMEGYRLFGQPEVQCIEDQEVDLDAVWSGYQPTCRPLQCPRQRPLRHGSVQCTDDNFVGSVCTFQCNRQDGYVLFPDTPRTSISLTCQSDEHWSGDRPCCTLPCPPFAIMDFLVILDSSSSVGVENWDRMRDFVVSFISNFTIRDDSTHVAAIRYNRVVDTQSEINFLDYSNDREGLLRALRNFPYDGSGTRTGNAINHVTNNVLRDGNRELARDIILLITDGASQDRVGIPAARLRRTGADVYVLPIRVEGAAIDLDQIEQIAGREHPERVLRDALDGGFDALDEAFANRITDLLCNQPCYNPLHNHPDDARLP